MCVCSVVSFFFCKLNFLKEKEDEGFSDEDSNQAGCRGPFIVCVCESFSLFSFSDLLSSHTAHVRA